MGRPPEERDAGAVAVEDKAAGMGQELQEGGPSGPRVSATACGLSGGPARQSVRGARKQRPVAAVLSSCLSEA